LVDGGKGIDYRGGMKRSPQVAPTLKAWQEELRVQGLLVASEFRIANTICSPVISRCFESLTGMAGNAA